MALGAGYADEDLVVCRVDGTPLPPKPFGDYVATGTRDAGLPVIRLHDLRHTHATLALRACVHPRIVQERLGHANISITLDTYSHVDLDMQAAPNRSHRRFGWASLRVRDHSVTDSAPETEEAAPAWSLT